MSSASADQNQSTSAQENLTSRTAATIAATTTHGFARGTDEERKYARERFDDHMVIGSNTDAPFVMDMRPHTETSRPRRVYAAKELVSDAGFTVLQFTKPPQRSVNDLSDWTEGGPRALARQLTLASEDNNHMVDLRANASDSAMGDDEPNTEHALRESRASGFWSSADQPNRGHVSQFSNRKTGYKPKGHAMSKSGGNHVANSTSPASTNPSKFWIGTYYPTPAEQANYLESATLPEIRMNMGAAGDIDVWRGQWEMGGQGDKAGKLHVQFAVIFNMKVRAPQAKRILSNVVIDGEVCLFPFTGWLMPARSDSVWDYVTKEETRVATIPDYGECRDASGERSDLDFIYERIAAGAPIYEIMEQFPRQFMRNHAAISKLCSYYDKPRPYGDIHVEVWWGVTGSGKSHKAFHRFPDAYRKSIPGKWFEGYKGQDTVIFEEFNPLEDKELRLPELLKILDKYPYQVEIKGASCQLKATKFIFTTNIDPRKWYEGHPQQPALHRRINGVTVFKLNYQQQVETGKSGIYEFIGIKGIQEQLPLI